MMKKALMVLLMASTIIATAATVFAGPITRIAIRPSHISLRPGGTAKFDVYGLDAFENQVPVPQPVVWSATSGTIAQDGTYIAGKTIGRSPNAIKVTAGSFTTTASVTVSAPVAEGGYIWERSWGDYCQGEIVYPASLSIGPSDCLLVLDSYGKSVQQLDPTGNPIRTFIVDQIWHFMGTGSACYGNTLYISSYQGLMRFDLNGKYLGLWTSAGAAGNMTALADVATDSAGCIYTASNETGKVFRLDANGNCLKSWGSNGTAEGQFGSVNDIIVDKDSNVYVVDSTNNAVCKFTTNGQLLKTWDRSFFWKLGINVIPDDIDSAGNFYLADTVSNRAIKASQSGEILQEYPCGTGIYPSSVAVDSSGNVYVAAGQNACVMRFDTTGNMTARWGGFCMGGMFQPRSVSVGPDSDVYVASDRDAITRYDSFGRALDFLPSSVINVEVDDQGNIYTLGDSGIIKQTSDWTRLVTYKSDAGSPSPGFASAVAVGSNGNVYVSDQGNQQVFRYTPDGKFVSVWGDASTYGYLAGIAADASGNLWVTDHDRGNVEKFDLEGRHLAKVALGSNSYPRGIQVGPDGSIFAAEWGYDRIQKLNSSGTMISSWGGPGPDNGKVYGPRDVAIDRHGNVYVADQLNHRVCKFAPIGTDVGLIKNLKDGEFVALTDQFVTAGTRDMGDCCYIESKTRVNGIRVTGTTCSRGQKVSIMGTVCTVNGEKTIKAESVTTVGSGLLAPIAMTNKSLGGAPLDYDPTTGAGQMGVEDGQGANNIGLLVKTTGKVTAVGEDFFYIDDGTHARDGSVFVGVRVVSRTMNKPQQGAFVAVTGISRINKINDRYFRCIYPRYVFDVAVIN